MKLRTRFFIAFICMGAAALYVLLSWVEDELRPRYQAAMEESMVDTAVVLATLIEVEAREGAIQSELIRKVFEQARRKRFEAQIYEFKKTQTNLRVYVTDAQGVVVFDSHNGAAEGRDFSRWNDVYRTLRGRYGARATRLDPDDPMTAILHVAAPIYLQGKIGGVLTVAKPAGSISLFLETARRELMRASAVVALAIVALGAAVSFWITRPIAKLTSYARAIGEGERVPPPKLGRSEIGVLGQAFEEMRRALEGKEYVENYVQTLTHQMKSPLSAIRGAAELLEEDLPPEQRKRFLQNLRVESGRMQDLVDRMLLLAAIENRKTLRDLERIPLDALLAESVEHLMPAFQEKQVKLEVGQHAGTTVEGEKFLLLQALGNLLQNALEFSPSGSAIQVEVRLHDEHVAIHVLDEGAGVPKYALGKVFDRFYSLGRPETGAKSSGLGLSIAREVAELHRGEVLLQNRAAGGAEAILILPVAN